MQTMFPLHHQRDLMKRRFSLVSSGHAKVPGTCERAPPSPLPPPASKPSPLTNQLTTLVNLLIRLSNRTHVSSLCIRQAQSRSIRIRASVQWGILSRANCVTCETLWAWRGQRVLCCEILYKFCMEIGHGRSGRSFADSSAKGKDQFSRGLTDSNTVNVDFRLKDRNWVKLDGRLRCCGVRLRNQCRWRWPWPLQSGARVGLWQSPTLGAYTHAHAHSLGAILLFMGGHGWA